jgi:hypothetical protein
LYKEQLPWWSTSAAQLWGLLLKMQPRICFFCFPNMSVSHSIPLIHLFLLKLSSVNSFSAIRS